MKTILFLICIFSFSLTLAQKNIYSGRYQRFFSRQAGYDDPNPQTADTIYEELCLAPDSFSFFCMIRCGDKISLHTATGYWTFDSLATLFYFEDGSVANGLFVSRGSFPSLKMNGLSFSFVRPGPVTEDTTVNQSHFSFTPIGPYAIAGKYKSKDTLSSWIYFYQDSFAIVHQLGYTRDMAFSTYKGVWHKDVHGFFALHFDNGTITNARMAEYQYAKGSSDGVIKPMYAIMFVLGSG